MADTTQMTKGTNFAVAFLPKLGHCNFTPAQLATALARCGFGKLVRADYAPCGIFAYIAYTGPRIHLALAAKGGTKLMTKSAHGPYTCIHLLPAHGWTQQGRDGEPKVLTQDVNSYDLECPDAGEGSWANWENKVQVVEVNSDGEGFAELPPDSLVEMLRERRWPQPAEPVKSSTPDTVLVMTIEYAADCCGRCDTSIYKVPRDWVDDEDKGQWLHYQQDPYYPQSPDELPDSHRCWRRLHATHLNDEKLDDADREAIRKVWPEIPEEHQIQSYDEVRHHLHGGGAYRNGDADFGDQPIFCIFKIRW